MARFTITAHTSLDKATLVLAHGWAENTQINTIAPSPIGEGSDNGRLVFQLGHIAAGKTYVRPTVEEVLAEARQTQIDSLDKIQWAVPQTSGNISFIEKSS
jgi:hypothetical protein